MAVHLPDKIKRNAEAITPETLAVAGVIGAGLLILISLRKGLKGIGDFQLTGSALGAVEWFAYAAVVGGTVRVLQTQYPDSKIINAIAFVG